MTRAERRIARVKTEVSIIDLMIGYGYPIHGGNREEQFSCDLHGDGRDTKPSGRVYPESNTFFCFTCSKTRDTIELVREKDGLDFWGAVKKLEQQYNLPQMPWEADEAQSSTSTASQVIQNLDPAKTFTDDLRRLTTLITGVTKDRQLPMSDILAFWEGRDKLAWLVSEEQIPEKQGRLAADALRQKLLNRIVEASKLQ